jgi:c-di-GMP-binding flagellar brake protein YcgR
MAEATRSEQERRKFVRLDLTENVRAIDAQGHDIGRVEKVGAGGMQIRLNDGPGEKFDQGSRITIRIVEPGNVQQQFDVEVRMCDGKLLGVQFLS